MMAVYRIRKTTLVISGLVVFSLLFYISTNEDNRIDLAWLIQPSISSEAHLIKCYDNSTSAAIDDSSIKKSKSIFFLETSCHKKHFLLNPRQACAIESAAKLNPNLDIYTLVPSPFDGISSEKHMKVLKSYPNVKIQHINMNTFFIGTPMEKWYMSGRLKSSRWPMSHASDVLRYTTLWKYGGYYVDLDVIMLKSFNNTMNFVGAESDEDVASGFLAFTHGHPLIHLAMLDLKSNFKGWDWGNNGPGVITRALKRFCRISEVSKMTPQRCGGFHVLPPSTFYAVHWKDWKDFFVTNPKQIERVMATVNNSMAIHVWNYLSANYSATVGSHQPYAVLASRFCPKVYSTQYNLF